MRKSDADWQKGRSTESIKNETGEVTTRSRKFSLGKSKQPAKSGRNLTSTEYVTCKASRTTTTIAKVSEKKDKGKAGAPKGKDNPKRKREEPQEIVAIQSHEESDAELVVEDDSKETMKLCAETGPVGQSTSGKTSATPMEADARAPVEVEQKDEAEGAEVALEISKATQELAMAVASTTTHPMSIPNQQF